MDVRTVTGWADPRVAEATLPQRADGERSASPGAVGPADVAAPAQMWGWLFPLLVTTAMGLLVIALAANGGRVSAPWADPVFWLGLAIIFVPTAARVVSPRTQRIERIALLLVLGVGLSLVRVVEYPLWFTLVDEFQHWRTALDILATHHLFTPNPCCHQRQLPRTGDPHHRAQFAEWATPLHVWHGRGGCRAGDLDAGALLALRADNALVAYRGSGCGALHGESALSLLRRAVCL